MPYVYRYENGAFAQFEKPVVREQPLTITVNGVELATFLCTPVKLDYLVIGFLCFEGIISGLDDIRALDVDTDYGVASVELATALVQPKKRVFTSGCGMGLTFSIGASHYPPLLSDLSLAPDDVFPLMRQLFDGADMYRASRGIHAAALSDGDRILLLAEDVGRHNALDKILGEALTQGIPTQGRILLDTGRISSEMLRKGAHMGTPFLISRTSPTTLSIEAAKRLGVTVHRLRAAQQLQRLHATLSACCISRPPHGWKRKPLRCRGTDPCATGRNAGRGRKQGKEFMDAALDAYRRHLALYKWRQVMDVQASANVPPEQAVCEAGRFPGLGAYQDVWERWWDTQVVAVAGAETPLLARIETAVSGALDEEIATRRQRGDAPLEDSMSYKTFVDQALDRLLEEEAGSLEEL